MSDDKIQPVQQTKSLHRPKIERTAFEAWVAKSILSGYKQAQLITLYKQEYGKDITQPMISSTISKLRQEWKIEAAEDTATYVGMELERLDEMEAKAWESYRSCGGTIQDTEVKDLFFYDDKGKERKGQSLTTVKTKEDPRLAMQWFDRILKIQEARRKVLKLEAQVNINNIMAVKGYAFFDPGKDWAIEAPNQPEANVIDAEFLEGNGSG